ncbi:MAG: hypothetical protein ACXAEU_25330 [Candidatus Hodarchaeales archaeon]|jgi:uncharacterized membrane protein YhdT
MAGNGKKWFEASILMIPTIQLTGLVLVTKGVYKTIRLEMEKRDLE